MTTKSHLIYPVTRKSDVVDEYFGVQVADPYRWLEDDRSKETAQWVRAQNKVTFSYLENIPYREQLEQRLTTLMNYEKVTAPFIEGDYTYFYQNDGLQNQYVLYQQDKQGNTRVFLDPNTFSEDGTTSLAGVTFSEDGSLAAYRISEGGSDWRKVITINTTTLEPVDITLNDVKFSSIGWYKNEGFYYSSYDKPDGSELSAKTDQHKLYYHQLGQPQSKDALIFGGTEEEKHRYVSGYTTEDARYLIVSAAHSTSGNKLFLKDLSQPHHTLQPLFTDTSADNYVIDNKGETLYIVTNHQAPNKRLVKVNAKNPTPEFWEDVIPETEHVLNLTKGGGSFYAQYMVNAMTEVKQFDQEGLFIRDIQLPNLGTAGGFSGKRQQQTLYYSFTNYSTPATIFELDVATGKSTLYRNSKIAFDDSQYISEQVFYTSKDGTRVPLTITHKKGLKKNGKNPTILYGYGGFNVSLQPRFSSTIALWLELGGIYAVPNLRGGGEFGKAWHNAGVKTKKQNVFDDFIAAAEYLIDHRYTDAKHLAALGRSNGGLLVGAVTTQRPDLFAVGLPGVGVLDMLRYHTFTAGAGWAYDYGTSEDNQEMFEYLLGYSPVHNVKENITYPAMLITTGDHDDRVVPAHSFKFAAQLQDKYKGNNPTLIRIETNAGHGAGTPMDKIIEQYADIFGFTLFNMGMTRI
ncbi:prolyl endopeptidase [Marinibactrum halimedae]|uniref:prolyl oligopeptidase n=2 Tax=Marinibactrum halimedae TaxID=1444977 RepID=A0AA37WM00_9GAMM|nr:prolyl endopeptidase [Marinibactrum halimedae]